MNTVRSEKAPQYFENNSAAEDQIVVQAIAILDLRVAAGRVQLSSPKDSVDYLRLKMDRLPYEMFCCLWLDNRHRVLSFVEMFRGTIDGASVHPREVVRDALKYNAAAVIFSHNHPSGVSEPSAADRAITHELRDALKLIGVHVLDHIVIGDGETTSMAEGGLI